MLTNRRRAERVRSTSTATTAAANAATTAIRAICQPGMPPATLWTTITPAVPLPAPGPPGGIGIIAVDAEAARAKVTAMTPRLASKTPNLLKPLMVFINSSSPREATEGVAARIAALLTVRRYGGTTASRIGSDYLVLCSAFPRFGASAI